MNAYDRRIRKLVERIGAERVVIAITYDKQSWWARRGKGRAPFDVDIEWEDGDEKFHVTSDAYGRTVGAVLDSVEAKVNGVLLQHRAGTTADA